MTKKAGHTHAGPCTTGPLFSREAAETRLRGMGFTYNAERGDWQRGDEVAEDGEPAERGRLSWQPDYCSPDDSDHGTRWWLTRPHRGGDVPVLPLAGRTYTIGLPVSVTVADDGTVTYEVHTEDASDEVAHYEGDDDHESHLMEDAETIGRDHDRRHGREGVTG